VRVLSSTKVVELAESVVAAIMKTYRAPNHTFIDANTLSGDAFDPLRQFSEAFRDELRRRGAVS
jgi:hypothetical protein